MSKLKELILKRFPLFLAGNVLGTLADTVVLWLFSHHVFSGYVGQIIISPIISFECAVFVNFLMAYYVIWKDRVSQLTSKSFFRHLSAYNATCIGAFLVKMAALMFIQWLTKWDVVICNLLALCVSGGLNFVMGEFVIFKKKKEERERNMALITMEDVEGFSPIFKGKFGNALANSLMSIMGIDQLAERYGRHEDKSGPEFINLFLRDLDVDYLVAGMENLEKLAEGPFVTISNHPYGGLDGLVLIDLIGHFREDYKVMANKVLSLVKTIDGNFIRVEPNFKDTPEVKAESVRGIRATLTHLKEGHPLGIFPSGAVSDLSLRERKIRDREWQESALRLIKKTEVPVVPVRFFDRNSNFFYSLGLINTTLRVARLPREILNKSGKRIRVGIGTPISVEEQKQFKNLNDFGVYLRNSVYDMPLPCHFESRSAINFKKMNL